MVTANLAPLGLPSQRGLRGPPGSGQRRGFDGLDVLGIRDDVALGIEDGGKQVEIGVVKVRSIGVQALLGAESQQTALLRQPQLVSADFFLLCHPVVLSDCLAPSPIVYPIWRWSRAQGAKSSPSVVTGDGPGGAGRRVY